MELVARGRHARSGDAWFLARWVERSIQSERAAIAQQSDQSYGSLLGLLREFGKLGSENDSVSRQRAFGTTVLSH